MLPDRKRRLVLIVDDDEAMRDTLTEALGEMGVITDTAPDGQAALERLRTGPRPCAVLLDMKMPRLDGEGLLAAMRAEPGLADLPVVTMSGTESDSDREVRAALHKPFDLDDLALILASLCD